MRQRRTKMKTLMETANYFLDVVEEKEVISEGYYETVKRVEAAPLQDRIDARNDYMKDMRDNPEIVGERIGWLLDGNYGKEEMERGIKIVDSPRMNRIAALSSMIAVLEWSCTPVGAIAAWKKLTPEEQSKVDGEIAKTIKKFEDNRKEEFKEGEEKTLMFADTINGVFDMTRQDVIDMVKANPYFSNPEDVAFVDSEGTEYTGYDVLEMAGVENEEV
jgi:hypothetical protein